MSPRDFSTIRAEPVAVAELRATLTGNVWHVRRCPFCRRPHEYAAGSVDGDPRTFLSLHLSLCPRARLARAPGGTVTKAPRSWWSGLLCLGCGRRVIVGRDNGLYRTVLDTRGRKVVRSEAVCGDCRDAQLRKAARVNGDRPARRFPPVSVWTTLRRGILLMGRRRSAARSASLHSFENGEAQRPAAGTPGLPMDRRVPVNMGLAEGARVDSVFAHRPVAVKRGARG